MSASGKILLVLMCGAAGYVAHPYLFPSTASESSESEAEFVREAGLVEQEAVAATVVQEEVKFSNIVGKSVSKQPSLVEPEPDMDYKQGEADPFQDSSLILVGTQATATKELEKDAKYLELAITSGKWTEYRSMLLQSMADEFKQIRLGSNTTLFDPVWKEERFYKAMLRWRVLGIISPSSLDKVSEVPALVEMTKWIFNEDAVMEEIIMTVSEKDDVHGAFQMLCDIWRSHTEKPDQAKKYFNLALACSLVYDNQIRYKNQSSENGSHVEPFSRYQWYVDKNESGLLEVSIDRSSARDLTFVVCAPVSEEELDWALKKFRSKRRKSWGDTYGEVEYLMERAVEGLNPYKEYTLPEILKEGGICGDQTYFCVNTARAAGIPAFGLAGVTDLGGHAWAAVKIEPDEWSTKIGRIGGVSKGKGRDPQTGDSITEQEVWLWSTREHQSRKNLVEVNRLVWLSEVFDNINQKDLHVQAVYAAHKAGMSFPKIWHLVYSVMEKDPKYMEKPESAETIKSWWDFCNDLKREFKDNPRMAEMAITVEDKHIYPYAEMGDVRRQLARDRRRGNRDAEEQADLVTTSLKRESQLLLKRDKENALKEIGQLYDRALRDYGGSISGFRTMAEDYFAMMKSDEKMAKKAVMDIDLSFHRVVDTGSKNWFRAKAEVGVHKLICNMYREIGEVKRAENMEKRLERQIERAKRGAL
ncbi:hypothetical protein SAMN02745181_2840 [Rubritalea squalenifaciens DSM 18772]|uniref:Uncharacterized protein n=1 Tax=Rubritalea squalenifaciens DSM 18772 TaxID=1123071 RepID=A0A1M6NFQ3_9BACT|nr:transglutaminase-like domain-containing protein [Rubritalea squalenifaciens]SHJ94433.1 hypothetical protein SAMN02745181_2840 [Rubritalea squalenifaciens DSM 18772]